MRICSYISYLGNKNSWYQPRDVISNNTTNNNCFSHLPLSRACVSLYVCVCLCQTNPQKQTYFFMAKSLGIKQATLNAQSTTNGGMPPEEASMFQNTTKNKETHRTHVFTYLHILFSVHIPKIEKKTTRKKQRITKYKIWPKAGCGSRGGDGDSQSRILLLLHKAICRRQHGAYHMKNIVYAPTVANYISRNYTEWEINFLFITKLYFPKKERKRRNKKENN